MESEGHGVFHFAELLLASMKNMTETARAPTLGMRPLPRREHAQVTLPRLAYVYVDVISLRCSSARFENSIRKIFDDSKFDNKVVVSYRAIAIIQVIPTARVNFAFSQVVCQGSTITS